MTFTDRQLQVVACIERRLTLAETGDELGISESAVKQHVAAVRRKLGVAKTRQVPEAMRLLGRSA